MKKHIIITGASRGIGYDTVLYLAELGCTVTAISRSADKLAQLSAVNSQNIHTLALDITSPEASERISGHNKEHQLSIDGFVHNAGLLINKPFSELTDEDWEAQLNVNLMAPVRLTKNLLPYFNNGAHIVMIGSMGGFQGSSKFRGLSAYSASKGALSVATECLAVELAEQNIMCNCLCLGAVQTTMIEQAFPGFLAPVQAKQMGTFIGDFVLKFHAFFNGKILPVALNNPS